MLELVNLLLPTLPGSTRDGFLAAGGRPRTAGSLSDRSQADSITFDPGGAHGPDEARARRCADPKAAFVRIGATLGDR